VNKTAIKSNTLIIAYWLNILCSGSIKWRNCYQCTVNVMQLPSCTFVYPSLLTRTTCQRIVSTSIQLSFQCVVLSPLCNRSSETLIIWSAFC